MKAIESWDVPVETWEAYKERRKSIARQMLDLRHAITELEVELREAAHDLAYEVGVPPGTVWTLEGSRFVEVSQNNGTAPHVPR